MRRFHYLQKKCKQTARLRFFKCVFFSSGLLGLTASVPTFNGHENYVRKFVLQGLKVGIVGQTETAAEKKVNKQLKTNQSSSSGPFARDVTEIYTASTFLKDL